VTFTGRNEWKGVAFHHPHWAGDYSAMQKGQIVEIYRVRQISVPNLRIALDQGRRSAWQR